MECDLFEEILDLKKEMDAVVLAHNYQVGEIHRVADFVGDSLGLALKSRSVDAEYVVFAGVDFMAETAAVLNPDKKILLPSKEASCPMAGMLSRESLCKAKEKHPDAEVVMYVNTSAEVRAESDVTCTSSNAVEVVNKLNSEEVIFGPDRNLGWYVEKETDKDIFVVPDDGHCYVHNVFRAKDVDEVRDRFSDAVVLVHPESDPVVQEKADYLFSTGQMIDFVGSSKMDKFVIGTEVGLVERLGFLFPDKTFIPLSDEAVCREMKKNSLKKILWSLENRGFLVEVSDVVADKVRASTERMFELTGVDDVE